MRDAELFEAALARCRGQSVAQRVGPAQQDVVDDAQRVGAAAQRRDDGRAVGQRERVGLGGDERRRSTERRRESHSGAAPRAQLLRLRAEADVGLAPAVVPLERFLRRKRTRPNDVPATFTNFIDGGPRPIISDVASAPPVPYEWV